MSDQYPVRRFIRAVATDGFVLSLQAALLCAAFFPATPTLLPWVEGCAKAAIAVLFFIYGVRIAPRDALIGLAHWRMHLMILSFTFVVFPLLGLAMRGLPDVMLQSELYPGVLFMCLVPSTVQASIAFTARSGGNVPAAIASASASNLIGVFLTPALALTLMTTSGKTPVHSTAALGLCLQLLVPFLLGQCARPWMSGWVAEHANSLKIVGRESIVLVVYASFSAGTREGMWHQVSVFGVFQVIAMSITLVGFMLWLTAFAARRFGFVEADVRAIQFCGTKKALATGLPIAAVLFAGHPIGLLLLPLMIFHQVQLMMCTWWADHYAYRLAAGPGGAGSAADMVD